MSSVARVAANRLNAQRSTGPRTVEGKAKSSVNAMKHGLLSRQPLLADEDPVEYQELRDRLVEALSPDGAVEELLVDELLGVLWRLRRLRQVEVALFTIGGTGPLLEALTRSGESEAAVGVAFSTQASSFATLSKYEIALAGRLRRLLADLRKLQSEREINDTKLVVLDGEKQ